MTAGPAVRGPVKGFTQNFVFTWRTTAGTQTSVINRRNMFCVDGSAATEDINTFTLCSWCGAAAWAVTATWRTELTVRHLLTDEGRIKRQDERGEIERMISRVHDWIKHVKEKSNVWGDRLRDYMSCASVSQRRHRQSFRWTFLLRLSSCYNLSTTASLYP